jgi:hypothetical protein
MREDRLLKGAALLEADAANPEGVKFDLGTWVSPSGSHRFESGYPTDTQSVEVNCGTTACGWGLMAISGIFKDEGVGFKIFGGSSAEPGMLLPSYGDYTGMEAAANFFEIGTVMAARLFDTPTYRKLEGAKAELFVAQRMRYLAANGDLPLSALASMGGYDH